MNTEEDITQQLARHRTKAPEDFVERVMAVLPDEPGTITLRDRLAGLWPAGGRWIGPALAGAAAALLVVLALGHLGRPKPAKQAATASSASAVKEQVTTIHFELHAPGAERVELLGSFNDWQPGDIVLKGPDTSGHWTAEVTLPEGRYEYIFLVDGKRWIADPKAETRRPDGFGRVNTVIEVYEDENNRS